MVFILFSFDHITILKVTTTLLYLKYHMCIHEQNHLHTSIHQTLFLIKQNVSTFQTLELKKEMFLSDNSCKIELDC